MIQSIEIKNLRGIREGKLDGLAPLTVLVGPNGCGKSTILDAMLIVGSASVIPSIFGPPGGAAAAVVARHGRLAEWQRWLFWRGDQRNLCLVVAHSDKGICRTATLQGAPVQLTTQFRRTGAGASGADAPEAKWIPEACLLETRSCLPTAPLHQLYTAAVQQGRQEALIQMVQSVLPGANRIEILTEGDSPVLHVVYADRSVPVEFAGDGVHALLRLSMEIARRPGALVLIEEPEVHQHPGTVRQAMRAVLVAVRRGVQVVFTTHSLELIDILLAEAQKDDLDKLCLYRLKLEDGALLAHRLTGAEVAFARNEIEDDLR